MKSTNELVGVVESFAWPSLHRPESLDWHHSNPTSEKPSPDQIVSQPPLIKYYLDNMPILPTKVVDSKQGFASFDFD